MTEQGKRWGVVPSRGVKVIWSDQGLRYGKSWLSANNLTTRYSFTSVIELTGTEWMTLTQDNVRDVVEFVSRSGHETDFSSSPGVPCRIIVALGREGSVHIDEGNTVYRLDKSGLGQNDQYFVQEGDRPSFPYAWEGRNFTEVPHYNLTGRKP